MTVAGVVLLALCAAVAVLAWRRRLPQRVRTVLVTVSCGLLLAALVAGAWGGPGAVRGGLPAALTGSAAEAVTGTLVALLAVLASGAGGGPLAEVVLRLAGGRPDRPSTELAPQVAAGEVLRGGSTIGVLERAATTAVLLVDLPQGVAAVVAIKALGRYPELRAPGASERFIIGTLASLLWAAVAAGAGRLLLA